jgi:hypothetical protein
MRRAVLAVAIATLLLGACDRTGNYRRADNPPGQNPKGTPSDRTGGARNVPDGAGGGPGKNTSPADHK